MTSVRTLVDLASMTEDEFFLMLLTAREELGPESVCPRKEG